MKEQIILLHFQFNETEGRLDKLVQNIPEFVGKCQSFCDTSKDINAHRRLNSLTLTRNAELLEILEMPQLMDSCLRSNQYNEALELSQYARQLGMKHGNIPIISVLSLQQSFFISLQHSLLPYIFVILFYFFVNIDFSL